MAGYFKEAKVPFQLQLTGRFVPLKMFVPFLVLEGHSKLHFQRVRLLLPPKTHLQ